MMLTVGDLLGYIAALLVFSTFCMRTMMPLRFVAIASNVAFIAYGVHGGLWPIVTLHGVLLPLNVYRLFEIRSLLAKIQAARTTEFDPAPLLGALAHRSYATGEAVFRKGDPAEAAYYIASGTVAIPEHGATLPPGTLFGEIGIFLDAHRRTASAICETPAEIYEVSEKAVVTALFQHPALGSALLRLLAARYAANIASLEREVEALKAGPATGR